MGVLQTLRAILGVAMLGTAAELLLLDHLEKRWQVVPLVLLGVGTVTLVAEFRRATEGTRRAMRIVMILFVLSGLVGQWLHYRGNTEFERELHPKHRGWTLFRESLRGATPVLAPGTMLYLGFVGLVTTNSRLRAKAQDEPELGAST